MGNTTKIISKEELKGGTIIDGEIIQREVFPGEEQIAAVKDKTLEYVDIFTIDAESLGEYFKKIF